MLPIVLVMLALVGSIAATATVRVARRRAGNIPTIPFSDDARRVLDRSAEEARNRGAAPIAPDHILLALLVDPACQTTQLLTRLGVDCEVLQQQLESRLPTEPVGPGQTPPLYTAQARSVLEESIHEADLAQAPETRAGHVLAGVLRVPRSHAAQLLQQSGASLLALRSAHSAPAS